MISSVLLHAFTYIFRCYGIRKFDDPRVLTLLVFQMIRYRCLASVLSYMMMFAKKLMLSYERSYDVSACSEGLRGALVHYMMNAVRVPFSSQSGNLTSTMKNISFPRDRTVAPWVFLTHYLRYRGASSYSREDEMDEVCLGRLEISWR